MFDQIAERYLWQGTPRGCFQQIIRGNWRNSGQSCFGNFDIARILFDADEVTVQPFGNRTRCTSAKKRIQNHITTPSRGQNNPR